jgi:hypothetical protein
LGHITNLFSQNCAYTTLFSMAAVVSSGHILYRATGGKNSPWDWVVGTRRACLSRLFNAEADAQFAGSSKDISKWQCVRLGTLRFAINLTTSYITDLNFDPVTDSWVRSGISVVGGKSRHFIDPFSESSWNSFKIIEAEYYIRGRHDSNLFEVPFAVTVWSGFIVVNGRQGQPRKFLSPSFPRTPIVTIYYLE